MLPQLHGIDTGTPFDAYPAASIHPWSFAAITPGNLGAMARRNNATDSPVPITASDTPSFQSDTSATTGDSAVSSQCPETCVQHPSFVSARSGNAAEMYNFRTAAVRLLGAAYVQGSTSDYDNITAGVGNQLITDAVVASTLTPLSRIAGEKAHSGSNAGVVSSRHTRTVTTCIPDTNEWLRSHPILGSVFSQSPPAKSPLACAELPPVPSLPPDSPLRHGSLPCTPLQDSLRHDAVLQTSHESELLSLLRELVEAERQRHNQPVAVEPPTASSLERVVADAARRAAAEAVECAAADAAERAAAGAAERAAADAAERVAAKYATTSVGPSAGTGEPPTPAVEVAQLTAAVEAARIAAAAATEAATAMTNVVSTQPNSTIAPVATTSQTAVSAPSRDAEAQTSNPPPLDESLLRTFECDSVYVDTCPRVVVNGALRALQGEDMWVDLSDGSISGAALWLSQRPPRASKTYVKTYDICLPWCELPEGEQIGDADRDPSLASIGIGTSQIASPKRGGDHREVEEEEYADDWEEKASEGDDGSDHGDEDEPSPEQVLRRISGLMSEMTAMESSLGNLREELDRAGPNVAAASAATIRPWHQHSAPVLPPSRGTLHRATPLARVALESSGSLSRPPGRLRQRLPEAVARLDRATARSSSTDAGRAAWPGAAAAALRAGRTPRRGSGSGRGRGGRARPVAISSATHTVRSESDVRRCGFSGL